MKVATKLALGFGLLILVLSAPLFLHYSTVRNVVEDNRDLSAIAARLALSSSEPVRQVETMEESARKYQVTGDVRYLGRFEEARAGFGASLRELESHPLESGEEEALGELRRAWDGFRPASDSLVRRLPRDTAGNAALAGLVGRLNELSARTRAVNRASQAAMLVRLRSSVAAAARTERISWVAIGAALVVALLVSLFIIRSFSEPLQRLTAGTRAVAQGNFDYRLAAPRDDEFSRLARDFNRMTERLEELERAKQDFLSQVSHDLKTPLAAMREAAALLLDEIPGPLMPKQRRLLELSQRSGERLSSMISKLLDLSRMEAGVVEYEFRREDLGHLARGVVEEFETRLPERDLALVADLPGARLEVACDGDRMGQVLGNVLENAVKFSPAGGTIRLSLERLTRPPAGAPALPSRRVDGVVPGGGYALLQVADQGPGIPPSEREAIFQKFHRLDAGRKVAREGVGLGLAVCREIVAAHGGAIWAAEPAAGRGALVRVLLPGAEAVARVVRAEEAEAVGGSAETGSASASSGALRAVRPEPG